MMYVSRRNAVRLLAASLSCLATRAPANAQTVLPVHVGASVDEGLTPVLYAIKAGIFARAGLDVTLTPGTNGVALASAIIGGSVDIAKTALMSLITAHVHGVGFKLVAGGIIYRSGALTTQLITPRSSGVTSVVDINNKTLIVGSLRSLDQLATQAMIDQGGGSSATVRFIELPSVAMLEALESHRGDVASMSEPYLEVALEAPNIKPLGDPYDAIGKQFLMAGWYTSESFANRNPLVVQRFAAALRESALYTNTHHAETVSIVAQYTGLAPDVLGKMRRDTAATELNAALIQPVIDTAYKYRFIDKSFPAQELLITT